MYGSALRSRKNLTRIQVGQRFGRLMVTGPETRVTGKNETRRAIVCRCECGNEIAAVLARLLAGHTQSCGCLRREHAVENGRSPERIAAAAARLRTHGMRHHPLYNTWKSMVHRCEVASNPRFHHYGGRGIQVCPEWHDVAVFIEWIEANLGPRPDGVTAAGRPEYSLDRIDVDGNYQPGNVRWATASEQNRNQRKRKAEAA